MAKLSPAGRQMSKESKGRAYAPAGLQGPFLRHPSVLPASRPGRPETVKELAALTGRPADEVAGAYSGTGDPARSCMMLVGKDTGDLGAAG